MVHGSSTIVKYLLFLFNFIFWLAGIGLIVGGTVIEVRYSSYIDILGRSFLSMPILLIVIGSIIAVIGFFGCCGAIRESYCMTMTFAVLVSIVLLLEIMVGVACYLLRNNVSSHLREHIQDGMKLYGEQSSHGVTQTWDRLQQDMECCGIDGYKDWNVSLVLGNSDVPDTCCVGVVMEDCGKGKQQLLPSEAENSIYTSGCVESLGGWASENVPMLAGVGAGVAVIQLLAIAFACCLARDISKYYTYLRQPDHHWHEYA